MERKTTNDDERLDGKEAKESNKQRMILISKEKTEFQSIQKCRSPSLRRFYWDAANAASKSAKVLHCDVYIVQLPRLLQLSAAAGKEDDYYNHFKPCSDQI